MLRFLKRKLRKQLLLLSGKSNHLRPTLQAKSAWYGTLYGGFFASPLLLSPSSIVYSVGIGMDVSFDLALIQNHGCRVWGFDPTPKSVEWITGQKLPSEFSFHQIGLGTEDGFLEFFLPKNESHVSGSFCRQQNVNDSAGIKVEMKQLSSIARDFGHTHLDLLKIDIEGLEYEVLESLVNTQLTIDQICVEFHDRFFSEIPNRSQHSIRLLQSAGFEVFAVSDSLEEVSLIHRRALPKFSRGGILKPINS